MARKIPHGTSNGYKNYDCRCDRCRKANARAMRKYMADNPEVKARKARAERLARRGGNPDVLLRNPAEHGTISGINKHKRDKTRPCLACRKLATAIRNERVAKRKADLAPHGTESALRRHYRRGTKPCAACKKVYKMRRAKGTME